MTLKSPLTSSTKLAGHEDEPATMAAITVTTTAGAALEALANLSGLRGHEQFSAESVAGLASIHTEKRATRERRIATSEAPLRCSQYADGLKRSMNAVLAWAHHEGFDVFYHASSGSQYCHIEDPDSCAAWEVRVSDHAAPSGRGGFNLETQEEYCESDYSIDPMSGWTAKNVIFDIATQAGLIPPKTAQPKPPKPPKPPPTEEEVASELAVREMEWKRSRADTEREKKYFETLLAKIPPTVLELAISEVCAIRDAQKKGDTARAIAERILDPIIPHIRRDLGRKRHRLAMFRRLSNLIKLGVGPKK